MSTLHFQTTTTATPEQFVAGLTDFGTGRSEVFENSSEDSLDVHSKGTSEADVTEGAGGIWERLHYDWSDPDHVVATTTDSNIWGGESSHTYTLTREPEGITKIDYVVVRQGKNLRGRFIGFIIGTVGKRRLEKAFKGSVNVIESSGERDTVLSAQ